MRAIKKSILVLAIVCAMSMTICALEKKSEKDTIQINFQSMGKTDAQILSILKANNKFGFLFFTTDWCGWCTKLERETYSQQDVKNYIETHFVPFFIDAEKNSGPDLRKRYNVHAYPTVVILHPDGEVVDIIGGYEKPEPYLKMLRNVVDGKNTLFVIKKEYEADPDSESKAMALADRYLSTSDYSNAKPILEKFLPIANIPNNVCKILHELGFYYQREKKSPLASQYYERLIREFPNDAEIETSYWRLADTYCYLENTPEKGITLLEEGLKKGLLKKDLDFIHTKIVHMAVIANKWNLALDYIEKIPESNNLHFTEEQLLKSFCLLHVNKEKEGRILLDSLYTRAKGDPEKIKELITFCIILKIFPKEALSWWEQLVPLNNVKTSEELFGYAKLFLLNGDKIKALSIMEKAVAISQEGRFRTIYQTELEALRKEIEKDKK